MGNQRMMMRFARWHIWLAWLAGIPILMWTVTGLVMVAKPIEEVRGDHLRETAEEPPLALDRIGPIATERGAVTSATLANYGGKPVWTVTYADGGTLRFDDKGGQIPGISEAQARAIVAGSIKGGGNIDSATLFEEKGVPFDFRRPLPVWQIALEGGTHVYVGQQTGKIEAVRTRWWRIFDFMWGLHIMDMQDREDTSHPILILFAALSVIGSLFGCILMFRRRRGFLRK